jgi:hypothetical protein
MKLSLYKNVVLGGMLAGSLIITAAPAFADDFRTDRQELRHDRRLIDRDQEQLARDRQILDTHLREGAGRRQIAADEQRVRDDEAKLDRDMAELRRDRRDFNETYSWNDWYSYSR